MWAILSKTLFFPEINGVCGGWGVIYGEREKPTLTRPLGGNSICSTVDAPSSEMKG